MDKISLLEENGVTGYYTFPADSYFYKGHFKAAPVTPGVILTECMAQIGVVCLGMYLLSQSNATSYLENPKIALSSTQIDFYIPVYPGERIKVVSTKEYFRFQKLKCAVEMYNEAGKLVCKGKIAGMLGN